jgi:hypothetical protein
MRTYLEKWKREYHDFRAEQMKRDSEDQRWFNWATRRPLAHDGPRRSSAHDGSLSHSLLAQPVYEGRVTHGIDDVDLNYADLDRTRTLPAIHHYL